jgi:MFS-type transporter involved in bile tolerance (Atg22 family)
VSVITVIRVARDAGAGNQMLGCGGLARRQSPNVSFRKIGLWRMNLEATRRNEKRRLAALWFNGASTASVAVGIFTPVAGAIFDPERARRSFDALGFTLLGSIMAALIWSRSAGHS